MHERYWIRPEGVGRWKGVSKRRYMQAERDAGFTPKTPGEPATAGFSGHGLEGKVTHIKHEPRKKKRRLARVP